MCWLWEVSCQAQETADGIIGQWQQHVGEGVGDAITALATCWMDIPTPTLGTVDANTGASTPSDVISFMSTHLSWFVGLLAVFSVIYAAGQTVWTRRAEPLKELMKSLLTLTVVSGAGIGFIVICVEFSDKVSSWFVDQSLGDGQDFGTAMKTMLFPQGEVGVADSSAIIMIVFGLIILIGTAIQLALIILRGALIVILTGTLVLSFSATNTPFGAQMSKQHLNWLIAFILYKPVAGLIYGAAFKLTGSAFTGRSGAEAGSLAFLDMVTGLTLMLMAVLALPALMKFVVPAVSAAAGSGGGAMFAGAAAGAIASGAANIGRAGSKSRNSDASKSDNPASRSNNSTSGSDEARGAQKTPTTPSGGSPGGEGASASGSASSAAAGAGGAAALGAVKTAEAGKAALDKGKEAVSSQAESPSGSASGGEAGDSPSSNDNRESGSGKPSSSATSPSGADSTGHRGASASRGENQSASGTAGESPSGAQHASKAADISTTEGRGQKPSGSGSSALSHAKDGARKGMAAGRQFSDQVNNEINPEDGPSGSR